MTQQNNEAFEKEFDSQEAPAHYSHEEACAWSCGAAYGWQAALASTPAQKPLSDDEIRKIWFSLEHEIGKHISYGAKLARAIEKAHGIGE